MAGLDKVFDDDITGDMSRMAMLLSMGLTVGGKIQGALVNVQPSHCLNGMAKGTAGIHQGFHASFWSEIAPRVASRLFKREPRWRLRISR